MIASNLKRGMLIKVEDGYGAYIKDGELYIFPDSSMPYLSLYKSHHRVDPCMVYVGKERVESKNKKKIARQFLVDGSLVTLVNCNARKYNPI